MKVGSLFSGIGGIDLGLERAGMEIAWQVENNEFCRRVLARHWPDVPRWDDVCTFPGWPCDLIAAGFPCQPVSHAGDQKGDRHNAWLWPHVIKSICRIRPRFVLLENVPGLRSLGLGRVLGDLADIGYSAEWESIPAAAIGAPHIRTRVWVVCYANGNGQPVLPEHAALAGLRPYDTNWTVQPKRLGVADGIPDRLDRMRALGNAVVPQVAEWIGRRIMEHGHGSLPSRSPGMSADA